MKGIYEFTNLCKSFNSDGRAFRSCLQDGFFPGKINATPGRGKVLLFDRLEATRIGLFLELYEVLGLQREPAKLLSMKPTDNQLQEAIDEYSLPEFDCQTYDAIGQSSDIDDEDILVKEQHYIATHRPNGFILLFTEAADYQIINYYSGESETAKGLSDEIDLSKAAIAVNLFEIIKKVEA